MFTVCPKCTKQFRLYAEHIAAASGQVRCGFCNAQFNALDHLHDEPLSNELISKIVQPEPKLEQESVIETVSEISKHEESQSEQDLIISNTTVSREIELDTAIHEIGVDDAAEADKIQTKDEVYKEDTPDPIELEVRETHYDFPDVDEILSEEPKKRRWIPTLFWTGACFVGLIAITLQLAWFNRDLVSMKYPQVTPYIKRVCNELDCRSLRYRDTQAIKLVNRDVRLHPNYQDTLLVNATMNNELSVHQPYPRVQLTLFDTSGSLLGHRKFIPSDYLDESIDLDEGMPINIPVHFVLEVSGPTAGAVSFEFRFL